MKIALVHDDLVQWGGAEKVFAQLCEIFPDADIYTSVFDSQNEKLKRFLGKKIKTSFLQKIPHWKKFYKILMPLYPIAFEQFDFTKYDLVISHTTRFGKSIITKPQTKHISYIHTPPRFLWNFSKMSTPFIFNFLATKLRIYDQISARRVDLFIAGSKNASLRVKKIYKMNSIICRPFVEDHFFQSSKSYDGKYFLIVSRLNQYKRVDLAIDVFNQQKMNLKIVGIGPELENLKSQALENIEFLESVSDQTLIRLYMGCTALIIPGEEDFGISSLEAQAMGKPVIAYKLGGSLETVVENITGIFFEHQTVQSLAKALDIFFLKKFDKVNIVKNAFLFSKNEFRKNFLQTIQTQI